jgi:hypothetical protein
MTTQEQTALVLQRSLLQRALATRDPGRLLLRFHASVVDAYRERGAKVIRTRSVGRITFPGRWSLDVGIAAEDSEVQLPFEDLLDRLPEEERAHWLDHLVAEPASITFLRMRTAGAACIDDGDAEAWT